MLRVVYIQKSQNTKTTKCFGMFLFFKNTKNKNNNSCFQLQLTMQKVLLFIVCACADRLVAVLVVGVVEGQGGRKDFHRQVGLQALIKK